MHDAKVNATTIVFFNFLRTNDQYLINIIYLILNKNKKKTIDAQQINCDCECS